MNTIGVLENPTDRASQAEGSDVVNAARAVGQRVVVLSVGSEHEFESAFASLVRERAESISILTSWRFAIPMRLMPPSAPA